MRLLKFSSANEIDAMHQELNIDEFIIRYLYCKYSKNLFWDVSMAQMADVTNCALLGGVVKVVTVHLY